MSTSIDPGLLKAQVKIQRGLDQLRNGQCVELDDAQIAGIKERGRRRLSQEQKKSD